MDVQTLCSLRSNVVESLCSLQSNNAKLFPSGTLLDRVLPELKVIIEIMLVDKIVDSWFTREEIKFLIDNHMPFTVTYEGGGSCELKKYENKDEHCLNILSINECFSVEKGGTLLRYESSKASTLDALVGHMENRSFFSIYLRKNTITNMWFDLRSMFIIYKKRLTSAGFLNEDKTAKDRVKLFITTPVFTTSSTKNLIFHIDLLDKIISLGVGHISLSASLEFIRQRIDLFTDSIIVN